MKTLARLSGALCAVVLSAACGNGGAAMDAGSTAETGAGDAASVDGASSGDAGAGDAGAGDGASNADGGVGATCAFNRECAQGLRCECSETDGCACRMGARGTGRNGVTVCTSGNDCASSVCVEGPDGMSYCSDECADAMGCTGMLPRCTDVSFVGRICVRTPPGM